MLMIFLLLQKVALSEVQTPFLILASPNQARLAEIIQLYDPIDRTMAKRDGEQGLRGVIAASLDTP